MSAPEIESQAFAHAVLRSERVRVLGLLWALAALVLVAVGRELLLEPVAETRLLASVVAAAVVTAVHEAWMLRLINRSIAAVRPMPPWTWHASTVVEMLFPTIVIVLLAESNDLRPHQALVSPAALVYFTFIILSTLRLSSALCRLTGLAAAAGYMVATVYVYVRFPEPGTDVDLGLPVYVTYGAFILIGGFVASGVAAQIRIHVAAALREAEVRRQKEKLERDLDIARSIQQGLLPTTSPTIEGFEIAGWNQPADETGGDYYDWQQRADGRVVVILADVTGHGIGAALVAAACRAYCRATLPDGSELEAATRHINELLVADLPVGKLVTLVTAILDPSTSRVELLSAGHGPLLLYTAADGRIQTFAAHGVPFGVAAGLPYGPAQEISLAPGDMVILMTDGFFEWMDATGEEFGVARLGETIRAASDLPPDRIISRMYEAVRDFSGGTLQADDLTAVVIKRSRE